MFRLFHTSWVYQYTCGHGYQVAVVYYKGSYQLLQKLAYICNLNYCGDNQYSSSWITWTKVWALRPFPKFRIVQWIGVILPKVWTCINAVLHLCLV